VGIVKKTGIPIFNDTWHRLVTNVICIGLYWKYYKSVFLWAPNHNKVANETRYDIFCLNVIECSLYAIRPNEWMKLRNIWIFAGANYTESIIESQFLFVRFELVGRDCHTWRWFTHVSHSPSCTHADNIARNVLRIQRANTLQTFCVTAKRTITCKHSGRVWL